MYYINISQKKKLIKPGTHPLRNLVKVYVSHTQGSLPFREVDGMQASLEGVDVVLAEHSVKGLVDEGQETLNIDLIQRAVPALTHTSDNKLV